MILLQHHNVRWFSDPFYKYFLTWSLPISKRQTVETTLGGFNTFFLCNISTTYIYMYVVVHMYIEWAGSTEIKAEILHYTHSSHSSALLCSIMRHTLHSLSFCCCAASATAIFHPIRVLLETPFPPPNSIPSSVNFVFLSFICDIYEPEYT